MRFVLAAAVVLGVASASASACSDGGDDPSSVSTTTVVRTSAADAPLAVGDCGDVPAVTVGGALDPATFTPVPCDSAHDVEIGAVFDFPAGEDLDFPGRPAVDGYANEQCLARFEPYVGAEYEASSLDFYIVAPGEDGWDDGDRRIACVLYQVDFAPLTRSVADSGL